ncbi:hypothetical protein AB6A40_004149 [Gnathostoma spinigerum]|uniref:THAP-type domain-containing protein n=1 Tax=Gnathostoma spinigerum TaxID=75299 RepID=A0ABD6ECS8_9BILA
MPLAAPSICDLCQRSTHFLYAFPSDPSEHNEWFLKLNLGEEVEKAIRERIAAKERIRICEVHFDSSALVKLPDGKTAVRRTVGPRDMRNPTNHSTVAQQSETEANSPSPILRRSTRRRRSTRIAEESMLFSQKSRRSNSKRSMVADHVNKKGSAANDGKGGDGILVHVKSETEDSTHPMEASVAREVHPKSNKGMVTDHNANKKAVAKVKEVSHLTSASKVKEEVVDPNSPSKSSDASHLKENSGNSVTVPNVSGRNNQNRNENSPATSAATVNKDNCLAPRNNSENKCDSAKENNPSPETGEEEEPKISIETKDQFFMVDSDTLLDLFKRCPECGELVTDVILSADGTMPSVTWHCQGECGTSVWAYCHCVIIFK